MSSFKAIDVETANADRSSICQIGIVDVVRDRIESQWSVLVNPEAWFDGINIAIHGINQEAIKDSPTLPQIETELRDRLNDSVVVSHSVFDRTALTRAFERYGLKALQAKWLDSAKIARLTWPEAHQKRGSGLKVVAESLGISFEHHDAGEDARAAAEIVLRACKEKRFALDDMFEYINQPRSRSRSSRVTREGNIYGPLYGETIVFTGALSLPRNKAANLAATAGCTVANTVTKSTSILVVGIQNQSALAGYSKSSKHRKAENLIKQGVEIRILSENDFREAIAT